MKKQASLDKALLCAEQNLCLAMSLLRALEVTDFDRRTTTSGNTIDTAIWNDVMGVIHKYVDDAKEDIEPSPWRLESDTLKLKPRKRPNQKRSIPNPRHPLPKTR